MPYATDTKPSAVRRRTGYRTDRERHRQARAKVRSARRREIARLGGQARHRQRACPQCATRFRRTHGNQKYCPVCRDPRIYQRQYYRAHRGAARAAQRGETPSR